MKNPSHEQMVSNIRHCWARTTQDDVTAGQDWYRQAHQIAIDWSGRTWDTGRSTEQVAGVIAALSPLTPWKRNLELASMTLSLSGPIYIPTLQGNVEKARRILSGEDPWQVLTSQKVRAFFEGILYNGETDTVCVDRHALSVAHGGPVTKQSQSMTPRQYAQVAAAYVEVAIELGIPAAKLQAITWVAWRRQHGIED